MKTFIMGAAVFLAVAGVALAIAPRCTPGDAGTYIGGLLMGGCPATVRR